MPWNLLQLDRDTASSRDVKRAYARLLKTCRPDQDPEGFRRLHDAYESALSHAESRERNAAAQESPPPSTGIEPGEISVPGMSQAVPSYLPGSDGITAAFEPLIQALQGDGKNVPDLVRQVEQALYAHPEACEVWSGIMSRLLVDFGMNKELSLKPEAMLFELGHEHFAATFQIIERLDGLGRVAGIDGLAEVILGSGLKTHAAAVAAMRLAFAGAVWSRRCSETLANFAYPLLKAEGRRRAEVELDRAASLGRVLHGMPVEMMLFWRQRLTQPDPDYLWNDAAGKEAIAMLKSAAARKLPVFEFLREQLPPEIRKKIPVNQGPLEESWDKPAGPDPGGGSRPHSYDSRSSSSGGGGSHGGGVPLKFILRVAIALVLLLVLLAKACNRDFG